MLKPIPAIVKRSIQIEGHQTSISLEPEFWSALQEIAVDEKLSLPALITRLDCARATLPVARNLSSHIRVFVLGWYSGHGKR